MGTQRLTPMDELELSDLHVKEAGLDEEQTMFDPNEHPKPPDKDEEGTTDMDGERVVDIQEETPPIDNLTLEEIVPL